MEIRLCKVHRDSYEAVKILNSRLIGLGHERCSSLHVLSIPEDRDKVVRENNGLVDNQGDSTRNHTGSFAGAKLTETPVKLPEILREPPQQMGEYDDHRSITKQNIEDFKLETVKPITPSPAWRSDFTGVNVADLSTKLRKTYRELPKLDVNFEDNRANTKQIYDIYSLEPVKPLPSKSVMRVNQVNLSNRANEN